MSSKQTIRDLIFSSYFKEANMTLKELLSWKKNPRSSQELKPILNMAIKLKFTPKNRWPTKFFRHALKSITYIRKLKSNKKNRLILRSFGHR